MSVVAARVHPNGIVEIGADTQAMAGHEALTDFPKLHHYGTSAIGSAGSAEEWQCLHEFAQNNPLTDKNRESILTFLGAFRQTRADELQNSYLIAISGTLWQVGDMNAIRLTHGAIGSGGIYARTALTAGMSVEKALQIACKKDPYCGLPIAIYKVRKV